MTVDVTRGPRPTSPPVSPPDILDGGLADDLAAASLALARRFAAGATMWCVAPQWEPHAHHMAVEFVHPVIVGKRALPAVALTAPDSSPRRGFGAAGRRRHRGGRRRRPGGPGSDAPHRAWGALSVWIGSGARPAPGAADHVLWIDDANPLAPATGRFVLMYHLLWELTHVCFEHPGLLAERAGGLRPTTCASPAGTRAGRPRWSSPDATGSAPHSCAPRAGEEHIDTTLVGAVTPATCCSCTPARP